MSAVEVNYHHKKEGGLSATFDGDWTVLSLLLEGDSPDLVLKHLQSKTNRQWNGQITTIDYAGGGNYEIYSLVMSDLNKVVISRSKLSLIIIEWLSFIKSKKDSVIYV